MGVLNLTPDSFSDGGRFSSIESALLQTNKLLSDGADIIDIGAESSRPGAKYVSAVEEWQRIEPILKEIRQQHPKVLISIDTRKPEIMRQALQYDVNYFNNIEGLADFVFLKELAQIKEISYIAMHMHKEPTSMQLQPLKGTIAVQEVEKYFEHCWTLLQHVGFSRERIFLDPGIGFGKDDAANIKLLAHSYEFSKKYNLLIGVSRKSFIGRTLNIEHPELRDGPSKMIEISQAMAGAKIIRTHDVKNLANLRRLWLQEE